MSQPKYRFGDRVRVRPGERCQATGDVTYGGWDGRIELVEECGDAYEYQVCWSDDTLDAVHRVHEELWWREQVDDYGLWFREEQLEPRTGDPPPRESLSEEFIREFESRDARIAAALGLGDAEIPFPDDEGLEGYYRYLAGRLQFPFEAEAEAIETSERDDDLDDSAGDLDDSADDLAADGPSRGELVLHDVTVLGLAPPDEGDDSEFDGIRCRTLEENRPWDVPLANVRVKQDGPNRQLVEDYRYWFSTWSGIAAGYDESFDSSAEGEDDEEGLDDGEEDEGWEFDEEDLDEDGELHVEDFLDASARTASEARTLDSPGPIARDNPRVGRNDLCPCGSGKKFKKCCLNNPAPPNPPPAPPS